MVDLAKQAFSTNNFDLAAEIYEQSIRENGPALELYLGLADSFARAGNFRKAFDTYSQAFRLGVVNPEKLKHLITSLIETVAKKDSTPTKGNDGLSVPFMFTCAYCRGIFNEPVTIPCGHTFCRKCLEKDASKRCQTCGVLHYHMRVNYIMTNILLARVIDKWFPNERKAVKLKAEANEKFVKMDFQNAIQLYSQALHLAPHDHLLISNRSHAYASLDRFKQALSDAELVVQLRPDWPKGYFRKGCALFGLNDYEGCVVALLQCLALDAEVASAKKYLSMALFKILSPLPPDDVKSAELHAAFNPSTLRRLINANFDMDSILPQLSEDTLEQLTNVIQNTITTASNFSREDCFSHFNRNEIAADEHVFLKPQGTSFMSFPTKCASAPTSAPGSPTMLVRRPHSASLSISPLSTSDSNLGRKRFHEPQSPTRKPHKQSKPNKTPDEIQKETCYPEYTDNVTLDDFECSLCYRLIYNPVTTPCGHSFCRQCLDRCLDHRSVCPLCKSSLAEYLAERRQAVTEATHTIVETYFQAGHRERKQLHEEEMTELARMCSEQVQEVPVFVCVLAFPTLPCPLHVFEPRYRLMIRQCMESGTRQFGMCTSRMDQDNQETFADFGTMLEIRDVQFFPDGRSIVDTVGGRRFKVLDRGVRDGYNTAKIEYLEDNQVLEEEIDELNELQREIYEGVQEWIGKLPEEDRQKITQHFGDCPEVDQNSYQTSNGPVWIWWAVAILPLNRQIQLAMLGMKSIRERLQALKRVLNYLKRRGTR